MESPKTIYPINLWFHEKVQLIFALKYVLCMLCNHFLPETSNNFSENPCWNIFWNSFYLTHHFDCVFVQNLILDCPNSCDNIRYVWRPWNWKKMWILHAKVRKVPKGHWADFGPFSFSLNHDDVKWVPLKGSWQGFYSRHAWRKSNMTWNNAKKKCTRKKIKKLLVTFFSRNKRR